MAKYTFSLFFKFSIGLTFIFFLLAVFLFPPKVIQSPYAKDDIPDFFFENIYVVDFFADLENKDRLSQNLYLDLKPKIRFSSSKAFLYEDKFLFNDLKGEFFSMHLNDPLIFQAKEGLFYSQEDVFELGMVKSALTIDDLDYQFISDQLKLSNSLLLFNNNIEIFSDFYDIVSNRVEFDLNTQKLRILNRGNIQFK